MTGAKKLAGVGLKLRLLGSLAVSQRGRSVKLPASRKALALLAYLALSPCATPRSRLCQLLFETVGDSRGELRWYLSKLRGIVGARRVHSTEGSVRIDLADCSIDALAIQRAARRGFGSLSPTQLRSLLELFGGDFLEGLEVDRCPSFTGWLLTQRRRFHEWRVALLKRLVETAPEPEIIGHIEKWLEIAPFDIHAHEHLLRELVHRGRVREGKEHLAASVRLFSGEGLDTAPLARAWRIATAGRSTPFSAKPTDRQSEEAYECFLQGRQHLSRMMHRGLESSREMFVRAIALDGRYGPAWAGLAITHSCLSEWFDPGKISVAHADYASQRALEVAPKLAESHVARGFARSLTKNYDEAIAEFEEAIRLNPYLFDAHYYFARTAFACGDPRATELFYAASQLRPEDFQSSILHGTAMGVLGNEDAKLEAFQIGVRRAEQVLALNPHDGRALSLAAGALLEVGQTERAVQWAQRSLELHPNDTSALVNVACVHARLDQRDEALNLLEHVFARGCGKRDWVEHDPDYTNLRSEPRFQRMLSELR